MKKFRKPKIPRPGKNIEWIESPPQGIMGWFMWGLTWRWLQKIAALIIPCVIAVILFLYYDSLRTKTEYDVEKAKNEVFSEL